MNKHYHELKFELYRDKQKKYRWRCSRHGKILFEASESYNGFNTMKRVLRHATESIKQGNYKVVNDRGQIVDLWGYRKLCCCA